MEQKNGKRRRGWSRKLSVLSFAVMASVVSIVISLLNKEKERVPLRAPDAAFLQSVAPPAEQHFKVQPLSPGFH
jgi:hypothetical protein